MEEAFFDRLKANLARTGQAVKNVMPGSSKTQDSKDAAAMSLFKTFVKKFTSKNQAYNDFLDDFATMFNLPGAKTPAGRKNAIEFMQSQGSRFQSILKYLTDNKLIGGQAGTPSSAGVPPVIVSPGATGTTPGSSTSDQSSPVAPSSSTSSATVSPSVTVTPRLTKKLAVAKLNPIVSGTLVPRLQKMLKLDASNPTNIKYVKALVNAIKNSVSNKSNIASLQKNLGGNVSALRRSMMAEDITSGDIVAITKEIKSLIPLLVDIAFELRQSVSKKNKSSTSIPTGVPPVLSTPPITEADQTSQLTVEDIRLVKAFLTKLNDLSVSLKTFDPTKATRSTVKPIIGNILDIFDIVTGKVNPNIKINKTIDSLFQGMDLLGPTTTTQKPKNGTIVVAKNKELGGMSDGQVFRFVDDKWMSLGVIANPSFDKKGELDDADPKGKELISKLNVIGSQRDDTTELEKAIEDKKLKSAEKARQEKNKKDSEMDKSGGEPDQRTSDKDNPELEEHTVYKKFF